jgi:hypothetical protein
LALQEAARVAFALPTRPSVKEMHALAETWRPWRAVAARILWSYYRAVAEVKKAAGRKVKKNAPGKSTTKKSTTKKSAPGKKKSGKRPSKKSASGRARS